MKKNLPTLLLLVIVVSCGTINTEESFLFDQIRFEEKVSKREVKSPDYLNYPKRVTRKVYVVTDSVNQIIYSTNSINKIDDQGVYSTQANSSKRMKYNPTQGDYLQSEYYISGNFVRPKTDYPMIEASRKLTFNKDGTCLESSRVSCSDSPCSTLYEKRGGYRMVNDTLNVTFYLGRSWFSGHSHLIKLKDVEWHVTQPVSHQYMLTENSDSLMRYNEHSAKMSLFLVASDTIQLTPNSSRGSFKAPR